MSNQDFAILLVDKLLQHDDIALIMYKMLYKETNPEIYVTTGKVFVNESLASEYQNKGGGYNAMSEINAELWLMSSIGEAYIGTNE